MYTNADAAHLVKKCNNFKPILAIRPLYTHLHPHPQTHSNLSLRMVGVKIVNTSIGVCFGFLYWSLEYETGF